MLTALWYPTISIYSVNINGSQSHFPRFNRSSRRNYASCVGTGHFLFRAQARYCRRFPLSQVFSLSVFLSESPSVILLFVIFSRQRITKISSEDSSGIIFFYHINPNVASCVVSIWYKNHHVKKIRRRRRRRRRKEDEEEEEEEEEKEEGKEE